jgi:hypothetical protein
MQRTFLKVLAIALLMSLSAYGQSLGDVARENRANAAANASGPAPTVITNKDLPKDPNADPSAIDEQPPVAAPGGKKASHPAADQHTAQQQRVAEQWRKQIVAQQDKIAELQARIDQINASLHPADRSAQFEGPSSRYQAQQSQHVAEMQIQLDGQKRKLSEMQEEARRAGMHTTVYDP